MSVWRQILVGYCLIAFSPVALLIVVLIQDYRQERRDMAAARAQAMLARDSAATLDAIVRIGARHVQDSVDTAIERYAAAHATPDDVTLAATALPDFAAYDALVPAELLARVERGERP